MLPPRDLLPEVLPTERLSATGRPAPQLREELRRIPNLLNVWSVAGAYVQSFGLIALTVWIGHPLAYVATFALMGRSHARFAILAHEAAHRLLFTKKLWNDGVGKWLLAYPSFVAFDAYRRAHMAHHKDEMGPDEPDLNLYLGYPITRDSMVRKLKRDLFFQSGYKNLKGLYFAFKSPSARPVALKILAAQIAVLAVFTVFGRPWLYFLFWLAPWMTVWRVLNRLRAIAEHGGMSRSSDRRLTTHVVRQSWLARFWMVPYNTGWHLAHHVDMGIPWRNLPKLHDELVRSGWVVEDITYPSYFALWRALSSRPTVPAAQ